MQTQSELDYLVDYRKEIKQFFESHKKKSEATYVDYATWIRTVLLKPSPLNIDRKSDPEGWFEQILDVSEEFVKFALQNRRGAVMQIIDWMNSSSNGANTIIYKLAALSSLCEWCEVPMPWKKIKGVAPKKLDPDMRAPPREAVKKLYDMLDIRGKVMISLSMCASRVGAYKWFQLKHLREIEVEGFKIGRITIYPGEPEEYPSYITPEGMANLSLYLSLRKQGGETITPESPLVRNRFDVYNKVIALTPETVGRTFAAWWKKVGYPTVEDHKKGAPGIPRDWAVVHGFRKFAETELENAGMSHECAEIILGHSYQYKKMQDSDVAKAFVKSMHGLYMSDEYKKDEEIKQKDTYIKTTEKDLKMSLIIERDERKKLQEAFLLSSEMQGINFELQQEKDETRHAQLMDRFLELHARLKEYQK